ncbi:MAG: YceI family protein [Actinobacteria bacterium]|jgi:polyisoprenoid-binding protein YceI|nr:YceI family protein [Actinomycetota bacterium]
MTTKLNHTEALLPTGKWQLDTAATTVTVSVRKLAIFDVAATLAVRSGTIEIDENHQVTSVDIVADAGSYTSRSAKRNEHVVSKDFLDAESHPDIRFQADTVISRGDGYQGKGTATVKGKSSPVDVAVSDVSFTDATGAFTVTAVIDRKAIGIDKMPTLVIGQTVELTVNAKVERIS